MNGLRCEVCQFTQNDIDDHYCGKCGHPLQYFNRWPVWNEKGEFYEMGPKIDVLSRVFGYTPSSPIEWAVVSKGTLENAKLYDKLKDLILKEEKEGNSLFRTKKQFLRELLNIVK